MTRSGRRPEEREALYPAVVAPPPSGSLVTARCAAGDRRAGPARHQPAGACRLPRAGRGARERSASATASRSAPGARSRISRWSEGDSTQRGDRRRLGRRQGDPRPLHAERPTATLPRLGLRGATSATARPSTATRSPAVGSAPCTAARSPRPPTASSSSAPERSPHRSERRLQVVDRVRSERGPRC